MRLATLIVCMAVLLGSLLGCSGDEPKPLTKEQQDKLKERDRLAQKAQKAPTPKEAIEAMEQVLRIEREVYGERHEDVAGTLDSLGALYEAADDLDAARRVRAQV